MSNRPYFRNPERVLCDLMCIADNEERKRYMQAIDEALNTYLQVYPSSIWSNSGGMLSQLTPMNFWPTVSAYDVGNVFSKELESGDIQDRQSNILKIIRSRNFADAKMPSAAALDQLRTAQANYLVYSYFDSAHMERNWAFVHHSIGMVAISALAAVWALATGAAMTLNPMTIVCVVLFVIGVLSLVCIGHSLIANAYNKQGQVQGMLGLRNPGNHQDKTYFETLAKQPGPQNASEETNGEEQSSQLNLIPSSGFFGLSVRRPANDVVSTAAI